MNSAKKQVIYTVSLCGFVYWILHYIPGRKLVLSDNSWLTHHASPRNFVKNRRLRVKSDFSGSSRLVGLMTEPSNFFLQSSSIIVILTFCLSDIAVYKCCTVTHRCSVQMLYCYSQVHWLKMNNFLPFQNESHLHNYWTCFLRKTVTSV